MPWGILFIGGRVPGPKFITDFIRPDDLICAADSGLDAALGAGIRPHHVIGDMDSISDPALLEGFPADSVEIHPVDKDETDTDLGLRWLASRQCSPVVLIGGGEGRLDHTVAILNLFAGPGHPDCWYTAVEEVRALSSSMYLSGSAGDAISFVPVGGGPWSVSSRGLEWPLDDVDWSAGRISLSNRFSGAEVRLEITSGVFLGIRPLEDI